MKKVGKKAALMVELSVGEMAVKRVALKDAKRADPTAV